MVLNESKKGESIPRYRLDLVMFTAMKAKTQANSRVHVWLNPNVPNSFDFKSLSSGLDPVFCESLGMMLQRYTMATQIAIHMTMSAMAMACRDTPASYTSFIKTKTKDDASYSVEISAIMMTLLFGKNATVWKACWNSATRMLVSAKNRNHIHPWIHTAKSQRPV